MTTITKTEPRIIKKSGTIEAREVFRERQKMLTRVRNAENGSFGVKRAKLWPHCPHHKKPTAVPLLYSSLLL